MRMSRGKGFCILGVMGDLFNRSESRILESYSRSGYGMFVNTCHYLSQHASTPQNLLNLNNRTYHWTSYLEAELQRFRLPKPAHQTFPISAPSMPRIPKPSHHNISSFPFPCHTNHSAYVLTKDDSSPPTSPRAYSTRLSYKNLALRVKYLLAFPNPQRTRPIPHHHTSLQQWSPFRTNWSTRFSIM